MQSSPHRTRRAPKAELVDLSRGARHLGLRPGAVFIEAKILAAYSELDPALGQNVGGAILSVLGTHLATYPGGVPEEMITACLVRRTDAQAVEVDLCLQPIRYLGERLILRQAGERQAQ